MSDLLKHKGFSGSIEFDLDDNMLHGKIQFIEDVICYEADSLAALKESFCASVDRYIAHCHAIGKQPNKPFSGNFNVRVSPMIHRACAIAARRAGTTLNEFVGQSLEAACTQKQDLPVQHVNHYIIFKSEDQAEKQFQVNTSGQAPTWRAVNVVH